MASQALLAAFHALAGGMAGINDSISSRTPEGGPNRCPVCGKSICIEPSMPPGAPCPNCGSLCMVRSNDPCHRPLGQSAGWNTVNGSDRDQRYWPNARVHEQVITPRCLRFRIITGSFEQFVKRINLLLLGWNSSTSTAGEFLFNIVAVIAPR